VGILGGVEKSLAADFYITQNASGSNTGADCANAHAVSFFNTSGNWANPKVVGKIGPGDTVHLCGTITSNLVAQNSGSSGSSIEILFEDNAKLSKAYWSVSGAIVLSGQSYIIVDGGINGIIENTANGTALANQQTSYAVYAASNVHDIEIKNMTIRNIYVRTANSTDYSSGANASQAIFLNTAGNNLKIHDCSITFSPLMVTLVGASGSAVTGWEFYNNTMQYGYAAFYPDPSGSGGQINYLKIHDNVVNLGNYWSFPDDAGDHWHGEIVHLHDDAAPGGSTNHVEIYNNRFGPQTPMKATLSASTAYLYLESNGDDTKIYNNLFLSNAGNSATNAIVAVSNASPTNLKILNNTFVILGAGSIIAPYRGDTGFTLKNNIFIGASPVTTHAEYGSTSPSSPSQIDYNFYYNITNWLSFGSWSTWTSAGYDAHGSSEVNPSLDASYKPDSISDPVVSAGANLTSIGITALGADLAHALRPSSGPWDIGAYEYVSGSDTNPPASPSGLTVH